MVSAFVLSLFISPAHAEAYTAQDLIDKKTRVGNFITATAEAGLLQCHPEYSHPAQPDKLQKGVWTLEVKCAPQGSSGANTDTLTVTFYLDKDNQPTLLSNMLRADN